MTDPIPTCRGSADPTRQAAATPKTPQPTQLLRQPCHSTLLSAYLLHLLSLSPSAPLPFSSFCLTIHFAWPLARPPPLLAPLFYPMAACNPLSCVRGSERLLPLPVALPLLRGDITPWPSRTIAAVAVGQAAPPLPPAAAAACPQRRPLVAVRAER